MREVTSGEIAQYRELGFVVLEDLFDAAELDRWREAVIPIVNHLAIVSRRAEESPPSTQEFREELTRHLEDSSEVGADYMKNLLAKLNDRSPKEFAELREYYQRVFIQQVNLWQTAPGVRSLVLDEQIGRLAAKLADVDAIRLWHDQALFKPARANPTGWHLDVPYWSFTSPKALSMWIALDDVTPENGCLYFIPESHKAQKYRNVGIGKELGALFEVYPEWKDVDPVAAPMSAGSASFHNGLTAHGAGANMTARPRRAMTLQFMPEGATFNGSPHMIFPPDVLTTMRVGDMLNDDAINPLLWSRAADQISIS